MFKYLIFMCTSFNNQYKDYTKEHTVESWCDINHHMMVR